MSLRFIIDGYNLLKHPLVAPETKKAKDPGAAIVNLIKFNNLSGSANNNVIIVFDGYPGGETVCCRAQNFQVVFSEEQSADDRIRQILEKSGGKNTLVVSDDNQVRLCARLFKARDLPIKEFIRHKEAKLRKSASAALKPEVTYAQMHKINTELRKLWLGE